MKKFVEGVRYDTEFQLPDGSWGVTFYGQTLEGPAAGFAYTEASPREQGDADCQTINVWRRWSAPLGQAEATAVVDELRVKLGQIGWQETVAEAFETPRSSFELAQPVRFDTDEDRQVTQFELELERVDTQPTFDLDEVEDVLRLVAEIIGHQTDRRVDMLASGERVDMQLGARMKLMHDLHGVLREALGKVWSLGEPEIVVSVDLGRVVGRTECVPTNEDDVADGRIFYAKVGQNGYHTRFVVGLPPEDAQHVTVILSQSPRDPLRYTLRTAYIGEATPPLPGNTGSHWRDGDFDASLTESRNFWSGYALCAATFGRDMHHLTTEVPQEFLEKGGEE